VTAGAADQGPGDHVDRRDQNDFLRARRRQVLAMLARGLRGQPHDSDRLLRLDEVTGALG
jgi:hypothetical protein